MTNEPRGDRYRDVVASEVTALEQDIRHHVVDLEEAFALRDWAGVARIYRAVADLADRLEALDPESRTRRLGRADAVSGVLLARGPAELDTFGLERNWPADGEPVEGRPTDDEAAGRFTFRDGPSRWHRLEDRST